MNNLPVSYATKNIIFDTGSSITYIPTNDYNNLISAITQGHTCNVQSDGYLYCDCSRANDSSYPIVKLNFGTADTFIMYPFDYFEYYKGYGCWVMFGEDSSASSTYWILGDNFLRTYYQIYDMSN